MCPSPRLAPCITLFILSSFTGPALGEDPPTTTGGASAGFMLPDLVVRDQAGARVGLGYAELAGADGEPRGFRLFTIEPFVSLTVARSLAVYASVPITWTDGDDLRTGGELANLSGGLLYAPGELAIGAELSVNVGHAPAAYAVLNRFEPDHFADDTVGLRLHADISRQRGRLRLTGQLAVMVLADAHEFGGLIRLAGGAGLALSPRWTALAEYLILTDALEDRFGGADDFLQAMNLGVRRAVGGGRGTVGAHLYVPLDTIAGEDSIGGGVDVALGF